MAVRTSDITDGIVWEITHDGDVNNAASDNLHLKTGSVAPTLVEFRVFVDNKDWDVVLTEGVSVTDGSTEATISNLHSTNAQTRAFKFYTDSSSFSGGTTLEFVRILTVEQSALRENTGRILKANTDYQFELSNNSGGSASYFIDIVLKE